MDDLVENFFGDLEDGRPANEPVAEPEPVEQDSPPHSLAEPPDENRELFGGIAASYVRPVRQFLSRLQEGPVSAEWLEICLPAAGMVSRSAAQMGLEILVPVLERFETALRKAGSAGAVLVSGPARDEILDAHAALAGILPEAFALREDEDQRDSVIVHSMLRRVPGVGRVTLDKVFAAGLTTVEMLERANPLDLAATTGVSSKLSERVCEAVEEYISGREARGAYAAPKDWLESLSPPLDRLEHHHREYECFSGSEGAEDEEATRRDHRRERGDALLELNTLLAEMGEVRLVDDLQKMPFHSRIRRLRSFAQSLGEAGGNPS